MRIRNPIKHFKMEHFAKIVNCFQHAGGLQLSKKRDSGTGVFL